MEDVQEDNFYIEEERDYSRGKKSFGILGRIEVRIYSKSLLEGQTAEEGLYVLFLADGLFKAGVDIGVCLNKRNLL